MNMKLVRIADTQNFIYNFFETQKCKLLFKSRDHLYKKTGYVCS